MDGRTDNIHTCNGDDRETYGRAGKSLGNPSIFLQYLGVGGGRQNNCTPTKRSNAQHLVEY